MVTFKNVIKRAVGRKQHIYSADTPASVSHSVVVRILSRIELSHFTKSDSLSNFKCRRDRLRRDDVTGDTRDRHKVCSWTCVDGINQNVTFGLLCSVCGCTANLKKRMDVECCVRNICAKCFSYRSFPPCLLVRRST